MAPEECLSPAVSMQAFEWVPVIYRKGSPCLPVTLHSVICNTAEFFYFSSHPNFHNGTSSISGSGMGKTSDDVVTSSSCTQCITLDLQWLHGEHELVPFLQGAEEVDGSECLGLVGGAN